MFWIISVYFNIRNTLPKSGTFRLGHPVYLCFGLPYLYELMYLVLRYSTGMALLKGGYRFCLPYSSVMLALLLYNIYVRRTSTSTVQKLLLQSVICISYFSTITDNSMNISGYLIPSCVSWNVAEWRKLRNTEVKGRRKTVP